MAPSSPTKWHTTWKTGHSSEGYWSIHRTESHSSSYSSFLKGTQSIGSLPPFNALHVFMSASPNLHMTPALIPLCAIYNIYIYEIMMIDDDWLIDSQHLAWNSLKRLTFMTSFSFRQAMGTPVHFVYVSISTMALQPPSNLWKRGARGRTECFSIPPHSAFVHPNLE